MGRGQRARPKNLASKLKRIREHLGLSQDGILIRLGLQGTRINRASISGYEMGTREPTLLVLLAYAKLANVYIDTLVDDSVDLPREIPSIKKSPGMEITAN